MSGFLSRHLELIFGVLIVFSFIFWACRALKKAKKIDREGIVCEASVSRIEQLWDPDSANQTYAVYARYADEKGEIRETPMYYGPEPGYRIGERIRIRYIPGEESLVREVRE